VGRDRLNGYCVHKQCSVRIAAAAGRTNLGLSASILGSHSRMVPEK
jgi:hypothetical protein